MSYYPILKGADCKGWTTLCNFSPNNWEVKNNTKKNINLTWAENDSWRTKKIGTLENNEMRTITIDDVSDFVPKDKLPLLSISSIELPATVKLLPQLNETRTSTPAWRASLGLSTISTSTCYQGEIDPFPEHGTLLTFGPFIQYGNNIENYLIILNIEKSPVTRASQLELYDADKKIHKGTFEVLNNNITTIPLDNLGFEPTDLPLVICKGMSAIPLYMSKTADGSFLSLEHTHPPACYVVHGKRFDAQKILKNLWFSKVSES